MKMVPVPSSTFGSFYDGDCYIVLAVSGVGAGTGEAELRAKTSVASGRKFEAGVGGEEGWLGFTPSQHSPGVPRGPGLW